MARRNSSYQQPPPLSVVRGEQVNATYTDQLIPEYQGNPLIEALPHLWSTEEVEEMLSYYPHYAASQRELASELRLHLLENTREFFIPQGIHYEIHLSISNMLRRGYIDRNPMGRGMWASQPRKVEQLGDRLQRRSFLRSKARGLCIVGVGGLGKSTAVENILSLYPQVITHSRHNAQDLILKQLVWVKLQCPNDGSLRGMCINFIQEVDDIIGTNYVKFYSTRRSTLDELLLSMARVASNHFLGVIVFDEIQDLSEAKSGGATRMLNFFVQLENTLGIPFILIGTPKARALFSGEFRQARRISEQGDIYWRPMKEVADKEEPSAPDMCDPDWDVFVRAMWRYWYLKKEHPLPKNLLKEPSVRTLYEESKGITALVVTIFFLAQRRAITSGVEDLTPKVIRSAVKDNQHFVKHLLMRMQETPQGASSPRAISDLDLSAWLKAVPLKQKNRNAPISPPADAFPTEMKKEAVSDKSSPQRIASKRKGGKAAQTFDKDDFRAITDDKANDSLGSPDEFS
ncbi:MAG: hypothetical protein QOE33_873 [Acidobacteriota bacterium]|nr:hypothetical protein [Acidobacteriota bacterium]